MAKLHVEKTGARVLLIAGMNDEGKKHGLELPLFYGNMDKVFSEIKIDT